MYVLAHMNVNESRKELFGEEETSKEGEWWKRVKKGANTSKI